MARYAVKLAYDGTAFSGYQVQENGRTVQAELEKALKKIHKGRVVETKGSGRTDAGVHARGQVVQFDSDLAIPPERWPVALTAVLPPDVAALEVVPVPGDFHVRYDTTGKEYRYRVLRGRRRDVFRRNHTYQPFPLVEDVDAMREAAQHFLGRHDFTSFCSPRSPVEDKVRTITALDITEDGDELLFVFRGTGFLYQMVRIMTGTLLEIGQGKRKASSVPGIIAARDRERAGMTAPGSGLYLWEVFYEHALFGSSGERG
ncbi:tRNA pseudouridine(38-40) synthase TruA [Alteribacter natronophilus]|uniref:tRNA pseudouridine(38-40) synthase TruA n=1 Tax=Alteribacter natronophilus TaxID=2583810 RepID=UPI00110F4C05|nr:tRNA pseudouridine(38-40) synthase TruA [Alteribacter natronophilus]TMW70058.1 tRNA pseudouridine(38-40) synthase TruA [Alteribacter natronophilus]